MVNPVHASIPLRHAVFRSTTSVLRRIEVLTTEDRSLAADLPPALVRICKTVRKARSWQDHIVLA